MNAASLRVAAIACALLALAGCLRPRTSQPARFYVLSALAEVGSEDAGAALPALIVGVGPVDLPAHLDRPQMVQRSSANRIAMDDYDQWAEPLEAGVSRILAENLSALLGTDRVAVYPWERSLPVDYQLALDVDRFDRDSGGEVVFTGRWRLMRREEGQLLVMRGASYREPTGSSDPESTAAAMSRVLAALAREAAGAIRDQQGR